MKSSDRTSPLALIDQNRLIPRPVLLLAVMACTLNAVAQSVISTPPAVSHIPAALPQPPASESAPSTLSDTSPFQWGMVSVLPHFSYRYTYGNGIQYTPGQQAKMSVHTISPGVLLDIGTHWTLDYTPTQTYYSDPSFKDTLDHAVSLQGGTTFDDWILQISQTYASSSAPLIETGRQTNENDYGTSASADYRFGNRTMLATSLGYSARFSAISPDSRSTTFGESFHYQYSSSLDTSLGVNFGFVNMSVGTDMTTITPTAQLDWKAGDKTTLMLQGGFENRKFRSGGEPSMNSPTFGVSLQYQPVPTTTLSVSANRGVSVSYFANQVTKNTGWNLGLQQRLLQHYFLSAGYSEGKVSYVATDPTVTAGRDDRTRSFNVRLSTTVFQRTSLAIFFSNSHNGSNSAGFGFTSNQVGLELGYRF